MKAAVIYENGRPGGAPLRGRPRSGVPRRLRRGRRRGDQHRGRRPARPRRLAAARVPHIVGYLSAGTVSEVGAGVEGRAVGDRVVALNAAGSHAERRAVPAMTTWPIPDGLDAAARGLRPGRVRDRARVPVHRRRPRRRARRSLIHAGAGGVGMAAIQLAKQAGATVISTASSDEKLERLKAFGLDHGINYATRELRRARRAS